MSAGRRGAPAEGPIVSGRLQVELAAERRVREGIWRLPQFRSHGDAKLFKQRVAVLELLQVLPYEQVERGVLFRILTDRSFHPR